MTTISRNSAANSQGNDLHMYHKYKHQRATKHLIDLYEANCADDMPMDERISKATDAISHLKSINLRLRDLNRESNTPDNVGVIDYGSFLYGWNSVKDGNVSKFEMFCRRKRYMKGWSKLPPTHDYKDFTDPIGTCGGNWNVLTAWLQFIWRLLKQDCDLNLIEEMESRLFDYIRNLNSKSDGIELPKDSDELPKEPDEQRKDSNELPKGFDTLDILLSLHRMRYILIKDFAKDVPEDLVIEYEKEREQLRCMCEFEGLPCEWVPGSLTMEREQVKISAGKMV